MDNDITQALPPVVEDVVLHGPGRVKRGLQWLRTKEAEEMGLSLERLIENAVINPQTSAKFNVMIPVTCALGYAGGQGAWSRVAYNMGYQWTEDNAFSIPLAPLGEQTDAYAVLTQEWRTQLQALADEGPEFTS